MALLRGINLGGKNRIAMVDLAAMLAEIGCIDVKTYIQSGNAVFAASPAIAKGLPDELTAAIARRLGLRVPVVVRSAKELADTAGNNPFLRRGVDTKALHVAFLARVPAPGGVAALDPGRSPGDSFEVRGRDVYLWTPNGVGRSRLTTDYFDRTLATTSTLRNWNTVQTLLAML